MDEKTSLIVKIAKRATKELGMQHITVVMDLEYCSKHEELDLEKLLNFSPVDFAHDIYGINRNLNHATFQLENCFLPRCIKIAS